MLKTKRPYRNIRKLLEIYRFIERYDKEFFCSPSYTDIINAGLASSPSVVQFYFNHMSNMVMLRYQPGVARSCRLLPLNTDNPLIKEAVESEVTS
jgi:hypothetical protein